ncbi:MAG: DUF4924 family protein [Candidatus Azobacteroides sp.]|nr:DUF4924 family protein [Candidatus Azobacteroides sp.]
MLIAEQKKKDNIAEYLLYMWQIEDIIRAYRLDIDLIQKNIIDQFEQSDNIKKRIREWYENLIDMMHSENVAEKGHLQINNNIIITLTDLHLRLLKSPEEPFYSGIYYQTLPYIVELRSKAGEQKTGEIETCFSALYGILLLKLQGKPVTEATQKAIAQIGKFLAVLSEKYKQDKDSKRVNE